MTALSVAPAAVFPLAAGSPLQLIRTRLAGAVPNGKRAVFVGGVHGDELEGPYALVLLIRTLSDMLARDPEILWGTVDVFPAFNVSAMTSLKRGWPFYDGLDANRTFPGSKTGVLPLQYANAMLEAAQGADLAVDIHASNVYLREMLQIRMLDDFATDLLPLARATGVDLVWIHGSATVLETTLSYNLNKRGTKTLVVEAGIGLRADAGVAARIVDGLLSLLAEAGILSPAFRRSYREPMVANDDNVVFFNAPAAGMFQPYRRVGDRIGASEPLGRILDVYTGETRAVVESPRSGLLFTVREIPLVYEGSLLARMLTF